MASSVSSGSRGGEGRPPSLPPPPATHTHLFLDQTKAHRAEKKFGDRAPPYFRVWMTALPPTPPTPLSQGLDKALSVNKPKKVHVVSVCEVGRQFGTLLIILYQ